MDEPQHKETTTTPKKDWKKLATVSLAVLAFTGSLAGIYLWQQSKLNTLRTENDTKVARLQKDKAALETQISSLNGDASKAPNATEPAMFSEKMPNGRTITYPLTEQNAKVVWWYGGRGDETNEPNGTYVYMTTTDVIRFMSEIDSDYLQTACEGFNAGLLGLSGMNQWAVTTSTKKVSHGNAGRCIDALTDPQLDKTGKYKDRALKVIAQEKKDIDAFVSSVTFK